MDTGGDALAHRPLVLIVEDDLSTRVMYREILSGHGFRTTDAHNGRQALDKARECAPDAVVTDLAVPGLDGFEFCRALQRSSATRAIPVLAITGHAEYLQDPQRFARAGISRVLTKPCDPARIVEELQQLLDARTNGQPDPEGAVPGPVPVDTCQVILAGSRERAKRQPVQG